MTVAEYVVHFLYTKKVFDIFGIPGGVILELINVIEKSDKIKAHLSYHEQSAAFEAIGYSEYNYSLGAVYATKGPGFTNLVTGIADAYSDSVPVIFITAHEKEYIDIKKMNRFEKDQEIDTVNLVKQITKYADYIDNVDEVVAKLNKSYYMAMEGRKGPVFLDFSSSLWKKELSIDFVCSENEYINHCDTDTELFNQLFKELIKAKRPVVLIGNGIRQAHAVDSFVKCFKDIDIPIVSSRMSQDIGMMMNNYYGYIGSHGLRYANFIFSKSDFVIVIGNSMSFPKQSISFSNAFNNKKVYWIDIDQYNLQETYGNVFKVYVDLWELIDYFNKTPVSNKWDEWLLICTQLKTYYRNFDLLSSSEKLSMVLECVSDRYCIVGDVGNNEFLLSRTIELLEKKSRVIYSSKTFSPLGCAIGKSIGCYFASKKGVVCIIGDYGIQLNVQELQFISYEKLPIMIVIINNYASGMIKDHEENKKMELFHVTNVDGYSGPNFEKLSSAYGIEYMRLGSDEELIISNIERPKIVEIECDVSERLIPTLPLGNLMPRLYPYTDLQYDYYNSI